MAIRLSSYYIVSQYLAACYARSICSIVGQRSAIIDNRLFFSNGDYNFDDGQGFHNTSSLYWLPLNGTIDISGPVDVSLLGSVDLPSPGLTGGTFFYDQTSLYPFGAMYPYADAELNNKLWAFNTTEDVWSLVQVQGADASFSRASNGASASDSTTGRSFYVDGGFNGTIIFNSSSPISTLTTGNGVPPNSEGAMVYVRKGLSGVLLNFGGFGGLGNSTLSPFSDIFVYDISSENWYTQKATGDIPSPRSEFCAGVSAAPDDSSFQVTIHGGFDEYRYLAYNDVYVLTIPSFRWIKINDSGNPDLLGSDSPGRTQLNCDVWNETQLIVSGGMVLLATLTDYNSQSSEVAALGKTHIAGSSITNSQHNETAGLTEAYRSGRVEYRFHGPEPSRERRPGGPEPSTVGNKSATVIDPIPTNSALLHLNPECNNTYPPFKVLDTSTYSWRMSLNSNLRYTVPDSVIAVIGGNSSGGATLQSPLDGWHSEELKAIFSNTVPKNSGGLDNKTPDTLPSDPASNLQPIRSSLSKGAVAGVVIGTTLTTIIITWALVRLMKTRTLFPKKLVETVKVLTIQDDQWHKPELDASSNALHELDISEPRPRELHEEGVTKYELPGSYPSLFELP